MAPDPERAPRPEPFREVSDVFRDAAPLRRVSWVMGMVAVALVTGAPGPSAAATTTPADPSLNLGLVADTIDRVVDVVTAAVVGIAVTIGSIDPTQPGWLLAVLVPPGFVGLAVIVVTIVWPLIDESAVPAHQEHQERSGPADVVPIDRARHPGRPRQDRAMAA